MLAVVGVWGAARHGVDVVVNPEAAKLGRVCSGREIGRRGRLEENGYGGVGAGQAVVLEGEERRRDLVQNAEPVNADENPAVGLKRRGEVEIGDTGGEGGEQPAGSFDEKPISRMFGDPRGDDGQVDGEAHSTRSKMRGDGVDERIRLLFHVKPRGGGEGGGVRADLPNWDARLDRLEAASPEAVGDKPGKHRNAKMGFSDFGPGSNHNNSLHGPRAYRSPPP